VEHCQKRVTRPATKPKEGVSIALRYPSAMFYVDASSLATRFRARMCDCSKDSCKKAFLEIIAPLISAYHTIDMGLKGYKHFRNGGRPQPRSTSAARNSLKSMISSLSVSISSK
jgi:hypothetical protein